jgi:signal transduction histidine kinase
MQMMFEPLRRGDSGAAQTERTSLGLGLFIVRQIVHSHGGTVYGVGVLREREDGVHGEPA